MIDRYQRLLECYGAWSRRSEARWLALAPNSRGAIWASLALVFMSLMSVHIKYLGNQLDAFEVAWFRATLGLVVIFPFLLGAGGIASIRTTRFPMHAWRGTLAGASILTGFYSVTHLPLAMATAIGFMRPLFMVPLAIIFLHEIVRARRWTATIVGFLGVLVVVHPTGGIAPAAFAAIFSAFTTACSQIVTKQLGTTEQPRTMIFYNGLFASVITTVPAIFVWQTPTLEQFGFLVSMGIVGAAGNSCMIRSLQAGDATLVGPIEYFRIILAALFGFLFFAEIPTLWTLGGRSSSWYRPGTSPGARRAWATRRVSRATRQSSRLAREPFPWPEHDGRR
ncbi:MAG: DMT family transporter [Alphaproteobacteria bacterium]|nr:DMT family transporter [Alphaproteobacteria bacterium]